MQNQVEYDGFTPDETMKQILASEPGLRDAVLKWQNHPAKKIYNSPVICLGIWSGTDVFFEWDLVGHPQGTIRVICEKWLHSRYQWERQLVWWWDYPTTPQNLEIYHWHEKNAREASFRKAYGG